ncbi:hypothetical protein E8E13_010126 [Curvularia kusanoi]|uniref:Uncharacterized protein n=1 Tax=Curvularia kusanoi TaxID=90978 RepID=A0A9P4TG54_CURKU|nr:hypothetical protein E8E13_010126 [Curvularia kusanoi]
MRSPARRKIDFPQSVAQIRPDPQIPSTGSSRWFAEQYDFERRLSRFGVTLSEDNGDTTADLHEAPAACTRGGAGDTFDGFTRNGKQTDTRSLEMGAEITREHEGPLIVYSPIRNLSPRRNYSPNSPEEANTETLVRQLQRARAETQVWKTKCEARESMLREAYKESMDWRMKYENLYRDIIRDQVPPPR